MLDFQKKIVGPAGPQVFIFCRQNKYSGRQKLYLRINGFSFLKDNGLSLVYVFPKKRVTYWGPGKRPGVKIWSPLCKSWSHWRPHRSQRRALMYMLLWADYIIFHPQVFLSCTWSWTCWILDTAKSCTTKMCWKSSTVQCKLTSQSCLSSNFFCSTVVIFFSLLKPLSAEIIELLY